ncbi:TetR/AcrR family transcriptional regulator [Thalassovita taeanensis]|uniref:Transcriptional regulator, TetR family n=1 Tax=Thalassovita taeanensis TaxID=657014 RepID=A0A1H9BYL6_9RHOB|nr:TetR/AcrR family transcriptional regulator [Thalassovita taeanensis]SEP94126.1 transcriptional regulator, TetR family [Thalassovita taeanensis]
MARPSNFDRDNAVQTAMQEIWSAGFDASSVKAISEKLGITRSSYYNAFGTREALFKEALAAYFAQSPDRILYTDVSNVPILTLLTSTLRDICASRAQDPEARGCLAVNCLCEKADTKGDPIGDLLIDSILTSAARLEELLTIAVSRGELPAETDVHGKALALQNLIIGISAFSKAVHNKADLWLTARTTLEGLGLYSEE